MYKKLTNALLIVTMTLAIIIAIVPFTSSFSFAANNDSHTKEEIDMPTRTNHKPTLQSGVTSQYTAYGLVGSQFGFANGWLEDFFTDVDTGDTITYYSSLDGGVTKTQDGITTLYDEENSRYVSTYVYTPTTVGTKEIRLYAYDGTEYSDDYIKITLTVSAANSSDVVYTEIRYSASITGFVLKDANNTTVVANDSSAEGGIVSNVYVLPKANGYQFSGIPAGGDSDYPSGMTFDVPSDYNVDGTEEDPAIITIKQLNVTVKAGGTAQRADYYNLVLKDADLQQVTIGKDSATNSTNTPILVYANGNAELYTFEVEPTHSSLSGYAKLYQGNQAFTASTSAQTVNLTLPLAVNYSIRVPNDATLQVSRQIRNYQTEIISNGTQTTSGNYKKYTYRLPKNGSGYTYRISKNGCITRAGYLSLSASNTDNPLTVDFNTGSPGLTLEQAIADNSGYDSQTSLGSRAEDSVLLNAHMGSDGNYSALYHNYISLPSNGSYKIRGYRAAWQIINSDTANIMIEPDFHFEVVEGNDDDLTLTQDTNHNSWCTITPNSNASGVYVIKVTYDAIDIDGMSYTNNSSQRFYATAAGREGYLVVNVAKNSNTYVDMTLNAETSGNRDANMDWDSEIDTVYYTGTQGTFTFAPTASGKSISSVKFSTTPTTLGSYTDADYANGKYTVHPKQGYNMIKVTWTDNTVSYAPIRAAKVKILVNGTDLATNPPVYAGNTYTISLQGVYMPVPKFSGIYNPMMNKVNYSVGGATVSGNNLQYNFITQNAITWTPSSTGTYNFTNGYHSMRMFCNVTAKWGHHRLLTDVGVGANFNAGQVNGVFNIYPDFTINVQ